MLDVSVAYHNYRFIGQEFLTWLWYVIENEPAVIESIDPDAVLAIANRVVLENSRNNREETVTIRGDSVGLEEGMTALKKGALASELKLSYRVGQKEWVFNLKGEGLFISGLKVPQTIRPGGDEDIEAAVLDRMDLVEKVAGFMDALFEKFIKLRVSPQWDEVVVKRISSWISENGKQE